MAELKLFPSAEISCSPRADLTIPFELPPLSIRPCRSEVPTARLTPSLGYVLRKQNPFYERLVLHSRSRTSMCQLTHVGVRVSWPPCPSLQTLSSVSAFLLTLCQVKLTGASLLCVLLSPAAACSWLAPRSARGSVRSPVWCPACPACPPSSSWQVRASALYPQRCPWVCAWSSRVILLTLHIMGGDIYLPFGRALFLGNKPGFLAECNQEDHCPVNKIASVPHLNGMFKRTVCLRASPGQAGHKHSATVCQDPWPQLSRTF